MGLLGGHSLGAWIAFNAIVLLLLAADLGLVNRKARVMRLGEAVFWNVVWTGIGLAYGVFVYWRWGDTSGQQYFTGYVLERALSVDNIFVFVVIFRYFAVSPDYHWRILYWGILGALLMRGTLILLGAAAIARFHWLLYVFGAFLLWTGVQMLLHDDDSPHPERNPVVRLASRFLPMTDGFRGPHFVVREAGRWLGTPMLLVLLLVETTDLVFAFDSIPAIFGITRDPYIIYTSNVFAILGLRAMYFLVAALLPMVRFLKYGLSLILIFIGIRMLIEPWVEIPTPLALLVVCGTLAVAVAASFVPRRSKPGE